MYFDTQLSVMITFLMLTCLLAPYKPPVLPLQFAMVIITEHYDESLIMLRRQLCWDTEDIVYLSLKVSCVVSAVGLERRHDRTF
jgi:hypothetical protein